jgi:hypothetical protein
VPKCKWQRVNPDLLFAGKYKDPRPGYICRAEGSSPSGVAWAEKKEEEEDDDSIQSPPASESPPPQNPVDVEEAQDAFSICRRAHEASITNLHGWYPGKRVYGESEL